jgi:ribonucleoside-diphosphate reductase alpha subunit
MEYKMFVVKRDGRKEEIEFEKVQHRITTASAGLHVNPIKIAQGVLTRIVDGITTTEIDTITAGLAFSLSTTHPDYGVLASRIAISNHQRNTPATLLECVNVLDASVDIFGESSSILDPEYVKIVRENSELIESHIKYERDFLFDFFGFKTLERSYLLRNSKHRVIERPQHLWMRVAIGLWGKDLPRAFATYDLMSEKYYTHATPTLFNSATKHKQLSSCFLLGTNDSIDGIYKTMKDCALISKYGGGIGLHISNIRAKGTSIKGTGGTSNGIVPMLRVFNNSARYVDQCFHPSTIVYTKYGPKCIGDIGVSDKVLTSDGNYYSVSCPIRHHYIGKVRKITIRHGGVNPVMVTPEHPIKALCVRNNGLRFDKDSRQITKSVLYDEENEYVDAQDLMIDDYIAFPIPKYEEDIPALSADDCRLYGMLLSAMIDSNHYVSVRVMHHSVAGEFLTEYLNDRGIPFKVISNGPTADYVWNLLHIGSKITLSQINRFDTAFLHLPLDKLKSLFIGIRESLLMSYTKPDTIVVSTHLADFAEYIRYIVLRFGVLTKITKTSSGLYNVLVPHVVDDVLYNREIKNVDTGYFRDGDYLYTPIINIDDQEYKGVLHDFEIDTEHNYTVAHLGVAHNGGGKRCGSWAMYLEPWHADIESFLELKRNTGAEEVRARDLFYALWVPDLFMERVDAGGDWTLFCPTEAPGLTDAVGAEFKELYEKYERDGRGRKTVNAQKLWFQILDSQIETGTPYLLYKDAANKKSNQQNLGTIKSSNLCCEIIEYSSPDEVAVCNLASLSLPAFVNNGKFDFAKLRSVTSTVIHNLNRVIDLNYYPVPEAKKSNMRHRPIGLGVQGLADVFAMLDMPWESDEAMELNRRIFAHMYYAAVGASVDLAATEGRYETYVGSPAWAGKLQYDLWNVEPLQDEGLDWDALTNDVRRIGMRNSLLIAPMPTASTSQILGNCECIEPYTTHIFTRRTLAGEFIVVNKHLVAKLVQRDLWSVEMKDRIIANNGSIQAIAEIPDDIKRLFKTVWEIKQKTLIDMAAERGPYVCQSQSLNLFLADPDYRKITSMHFYAWRRGLKTGIYYLRTRAVASAQKFTIEPEKVKSATEPDDGCIMCSS